MGWDIRYTQAQRDAKKLVAAGLKPKAQSLLGIICEHPFQTPAPFEKLVGDLTGRLFVAHQHPASARLSGA